MIIYIRYTHIYIYIYIFVYRWPRPRCNSEGGGLQRLGSYGVILFPGHCFLVVLRRRISFCVPGFVFGPHHMFNNPYPLPLDTSLYLNIRYYPSILPLDTTPIHYPLNTSLCLDECICLDTPQREKVYILHREVQWKQGVVICMVFYTVLLYNTTPIHCTPIPLNHPVMNTQKVTPGTPRLKKLRGAPPRIRKPAVVPPCGFCDIPIWPMAPLR